MKQIKFILIGIILGCLIGFWLHDRHLCDDNIITVRYDSTIYRYDTIPVPVPYKVTEYVHTTSTDTLYLHDSIMLTPIIDTALILSDWLKTRYYSDTIRDSRIAIMLDETVQFNRITERDFSYKILRPTEIHQPDLTSFYIGADANLNGITLNASYFHHRHGLELGYNPFDKTVHIGLKYKLIEW